MLALEHPELAERMVLFNSPLPFDKERMAGMDTRPPMEAADYFVRQGLDADGLAADLTTPEQRRRYIATFYSSRFWAHPGAFMGDAPMVFGPNGGTPVIDFHTEPFGDAAKLRASFGGYESVFDPAKQSGPTRLERNEAVRALLLFGPSDHVIYPAFDEMAAVVFPDHDGPHRLERCGHFVPWEAPDALVAHTTRFCADLLDDLSSDADERGAADGGRLQRADRPGDRVAGAHRVDPAGRALHLARQRRASRSAAVSRDHTAPAARASPPRSSATKPPHLGGLVEQVLDAELVAQRAGDGEAAVGGEQRADVGLEGLETHDRDGEDGVADLHAEQRVGEVLVRSSPRPATATSSARSDDLRLASRRSSAGAEASIDVADARRARPAAARSRASRPPPATPRRRSRQRVAGVGREHDDRHRRCPPR